MTAMGNEMKILTLRKGNADGAITLTIPRSIADLYGMQIGTKIEIEPYMKDTFLLRKVS